MPAEAQGALTEPPADAPSEGQGLRWAGSLFPSLPRSLAPAVMGQMQGFLPWAFQSLANRAEGSRQWGRAREAETGVHEGWMGQQVGR